MKNNSQSLALRAAFAVLLTVGFYLLALSMVALLLFIPYAEWTYGGRIHIKILIFCLLGAGVIAKSIIPRPDRFTAPGPRLLPDEQPELFKVLRGVASEMGQEMPAEVYAIGEMNAWVMDRGGIMGFGGRRVMGLGLPLLQVLNVSQARGVIAHEFGHFYGGDTKLGPWIYRTRTAVIRTLAGLAEHSSLLQKPFLWYGNTFMRITQAISRGQEFTADRLAAGIVGSQAMIDGLKVIHGSGAVFDAYWRNEYAPALGKGYRPPLAEGFAHFLGVQRIADVVAGIVSEELESGETGRYDSHPSLRDRVSALRQMAVDKEQDAGSAISLLRDLESLEATFLTVLTDSATIGEIQPIGWDQVGGKVWIPVWQEHVDTHKELLQGVRLQALPEILSDPDRKQQLLQGCPEFEEEGQNHFLEGLLGAAVAVFLAREGWQLKATPGNDIALSRKGLDLFPFIAVRQLLKGESPAEAWGSFSVALNGDAVLGSA
jgi:Zn-dependent protease with chaperone function